MLIGFSGKIGSGKDTAAFFIKEYMGNQPTVILRFADKVKEIVSNILDIPITKLEDRKYKNQPLGEDWIVWRVVQDDKTYVFEDEAAAEKFVAANIKLNSCPIIKYEITPRDLMILIGTDCGRKIIHPSIWINITRNTIKKYLAKGYLVLVPDVRFENEVNVILELGGEMIRINRDYSDAINTAAVNDSETSLDNYSFKHYINNSSDITTFKNAVLDLFKKIYENNT